MEEFIQGKHFSITDLKDVSTIIYQIFKTEKEFLKDSTVLTKPVQEKWAAQVLGLLSVVILFIC